MMTTQHAQDGGGASVRAIDAEAVHRICSGQVVVDLATAVKELVENSLDAGSTQVDIRLRDHGSQLIEVSDNGKGISPEDYVGIARKHCTSKLRDFSDLAQVETFGFRGEALSSLCAVAEVTITTRRRCDSVGTRLAYDHRGEITGQTPCAREPGTTVTVQKLFSTLPVRHKQLQKNVKREYARLLHVLQAYCLVSQQARIHCTNQNGEKGQRHVVVASANKQQARRQPPVATSVAPSPGESVDNTAIDQQPTSSPTNCSVADNPPKAQSGCELSVGASSSPGRFALSPNSPLRTETETLGTPSDISAAEPTTVAVVSIAGLRDNVTSVFGPKQLASLLAVTQCSHDDARQQLLDDGMSEGSLPAASVFQRFSIHGLISDCRHGQGRSAADRQFFYVNDRPWDGAKASKVVNDVYHSYNRHQTPFVLLMIGVSERSSVDVNLTPDKRSILLENEKAFLAVLRRSLANLFRSRDGCFDVIAAAASQPTSQAAAQQSQPGERQLKSPTSQLAPRWTVESLKRRFSDVQGAASAAMPTPPKQPRLSAFGFVSSNADCLQDSDNACSSSGLSTLDTRSAGSLTSVDAELSHGNVSSALTPTVTSADAHGSAVSSSVGQGSARLAPLDSTRSCDDITATPCDVIVTSSASSAAHGSGCSSSVCRVTSSSPRTDVLTLVADGNGDAYGDTVTSSSMAPSSAMSMTSSITSSTPNGSTADSSDTIEHQQHASTTWRGDVTGSGSRRALSVERSRSPVANSPSTSLASSVGTDVCSSPRTPLLTELSTTAEHLIENPNYIPSTPPLRTSSHGPGTGETPICVIADEGEDGEDATSAGRFCLQDHSVSCSMGLLKSRMKDDRTTADDAAKATSFMVRIGPDTNTAAEKELERFVSKDSFSRMQPVGQFNLGFIVARCHRDLFLVDQHASDEKYNFERLQRTAQPKQQPLVIAQPLSLPACSEQIVMDNMEVFERSGFRLAVDPDAAPTQRVHLQAVPASRSWTFGASDIEEMVFMLQEAVPGQQIVVRPSRLRAMFASRACRSSIMIGRALNGAEMTRVLRHMSEMDQPWNCPHGRPTMRHLFDLSQLDEDGDRP
ncbi:mismatch repair endonuclease PMS2-like [Sycon ciliatum]|uniref:mismatch repair endonuclease PMS2-like n=1 Tax=Sycon ciliatum TaxID=27933 RepID=UPI0031F6DE80